MSEFQGVILAAGCGVRLYPVTENFPKPLLPVGPLSLLEYQLLMFKSIGITDIYIVIGHYGFEIAKKIGDGSSYGVNIHYAEQAEVNGSASAVNSIMPFIKKPFILTLADIYFQTTQMQDMLEIFKTKKANGVLATKIETDDASIKKNFSIEYDEDGKVIRVIEKPRKIVNKIKGCGIYLFDDNIFEAINKTPRTGLRNEYELTESIQLFINMGYSVYYNNIVERDINVTTPHDLHTLNMLYLKEKKLDNYIGKSVHLGKSCKIKNSVLSEQCHIGDNVILENCIVLSGANIKENMNISNAIIMRDKIVKV